MAHAFPEWLEPMAATLTQERFTGPEWIFERKFDGIRLLAFKQGPDVRLLFAQPAAAEHSCPLPRPSHVCPVHDLILDGEVTWVTGNAVYHVFDILWLDGRDLTSLPLDERHALLSQLPLRAAARARGSARRCASRGSARAAKAGKASSRSGATRPTSIAARRTG